jgi:Zn-dependent protease
MTELLLSLLAAVLAITLHEAAHGYMALALGDDTAKSQGRLSLNPLRHVDRFGTIILPIGLLIFQLLTIRHVAFMFGWAKPVPVAPWRFRNPRRGMGIVAAAGPAMNFFLAWLAAMALQALPEGPLWVQCYLLDNTLLTDRCMTAFFGDPVAAREYFSNFVFFFMMSNLVLGLFNLLPIPPLDGGRIAVGLLPERLAIAWARLERAGIVVVLLLVFLLPQALREFGIAFDPVGEALGRLLPAAFRLVLMAAGHAADV